MKNHRTSIIKGFYSALSSITYNATAVPVFSATPTQAPNSPYIQIGSITSNEEGCKDTFGHACTIDIQVIDNTSDNYTTPRRVEEITDEVTEALKPTVTSVVSLVDFDMINLVLTNTINDHDLLETRAARRNILTWSFDVYQDMDTGVAWLLANDYWDDAGFWVDAETWPA